MLHYCRSQWPRGLRRRSVAARLLRSWVRIPPGQWIFVCCECRVLSGRGLCDELITRPEESYRLCCVVVCDLETSRISAPYIYNISCLRVKDSIHLKGGICDERVTRSVVLNMLVLFLLDNVLHVLLPQDNPRQCCLLD